NRWHVARRGARETAVAKPVIARSAATKQSSFATARWIASLRSQLSMFTNSLIGSRWFWWRRRPLGFVLQGPDGAGGCCTTRFENAHRTVLREVLYRHHPWFGRRVCIHGTVDKAGYVFFRCTLEESQSDRWLEVPAWMFDRTAYPDPGLLAAQPYVSIEALAALSALLDLALKDQTPSAVLLSSASRASHDQNRAETPATPAHH